MSTQDKEMPNPPKVKIKDILVFILICSTFIIGNLIYSNEMKHYSLFVGYLISMIGIPYIYWGYKIFSR